MTDLRQPMHVVYGGGHLFQAGTIPKLGLLAVRHMMEYAEDCFEFADGIGLPESNQVPASRNARMTLLRRFAKLGAKARSFHPDAWTVYSVHRRVLDKLRRQAIEDYRIDFEDGYGFRGNEEEDRHAVQAAEETVSGMAEHALPPCFGIRIKPLSEEWKGRGLRTLELYLSRLLTRTGGLLPSNFVVTLPKVHGPREVDLLERTLVEIEKRSDLPPGTIRMELMVETPTLLLNAEGRCGIRAAVEASGGRCRGLHLGLYDFLSMMDVVSSAQSYIHPLTDHLRAVTKTATAGSGLWLSDGATNRIPVGPHRGDRLTKVQKEANRASVNEGWREVARHVEHSLRMGYTQGWDLHPSQLAPRFAVVFAHFLREEVSAAARLRSFLETAAQAMLRGQQFDDVATGQGLLNFFLQGAACGALSESSLLAAGLTKQELHTRSFAAIIEGRRNS
jgi:citrate lyase beta subunit